MCHLAFAEHHVFRQWPTPAPGTNGLWNQRICALLCCTAPLLLLYRYITSHSFTEHFSKMTLSENSTKKKTLLLANHMVSWRVCKAVHVKRTTNGILQNTLRWSLISWRMNIWLSFSYDTYLPVFRHSSFLSLNLWKKPVTTEFDMHKIVFLQRGDTQRDICQKSCHILAWCEVSPQKM